MVIDWTHGNQIASFACVIGIPAIATGLAAWLVRKFAPGAKGSGIPDVEAVLRDEQPAPPLILIPVKFLGGVLAMGAGLALGREGPTIQMGAGIGHFLATLCRRNQDDVKALLPPVRGLGLQRHSVHRSPVPYSCSRSLCGDLIRGSRSRRCAPRAAPSRWLGCFSAIRTAKLRSRRGGRWGLASRPIWNRGRTAKPSRLWSPRCWRTAARSRHPKRLRLFWYLTIILALLPDRLSFSQLF